MIIRYNRIAGTCTVSRDGFADVVLSLASPTLDADIAALGAEVAPPAPAVQLTPREFMARLSGQRQLAIMQAALGNPAVLLWTMQLASAVYIEPAHPDTIAGVQAMEAAGLITAEEAAALLAV